MKVLSGEKNILASTISGIHMIDELISKMNLSAITSSLQIIGISFFLMSCSNPGQPNDNVVKEPDSTSQSSARQELSLLRDWKAPDTTLIPKDQAGNLIRYGRELIAHTAAYLGPKGKVSRFANGMNCQNCHLEAGTKLYANSFSAVHSIYPKFRPRSGTIENLERRINDCMERSLNGQKLDSLSKEMRAMVAYINWVGKDVEKGKSPAGASVLDVPWLDRPADKSRGEIAYRENCIICQGSHGQGIMHNDSVTYKYPPLWGPNSYNTAAGMYRLSRLAGFIKLNMPDQATNQTHPTLTDEEAWDIAAFVNSMPRPEKKFEGDWPEISKKPVDYTFGPFADQFSEEQHKYGPYKEMISQRTKQ
jgi:thiosulfate dehydrogenase